VRRADYAIRTGDRFGTRLARFFVDRRRHGGSPISTKRWLLGLLGLFALFTAATVAAQGTKWHPGHYIMLRGDVLMDEHLQSIAELSDEAAIQGVMVRFWWYDLEPSRDQYDFSLIDTYLEALRQSNTTKRLVVRIMDRNFATRSSRFMVPDYLLQDPAFNGGIVPSSTGFVARIWEAPVMDRLINLYQALGERYDSEPLFEGAFTEESTLSFNAPNYPVGYSNDLLVDQYVRFLNAVKPTMPTSNFFFNANWIGSPTLMSQLIQAIHDAGAAAGGSNVMPDRLTLGQQVLTGVYGADYRLELPIANGVERDDLREFTLQQIADHAYEPLRTHHLFWMRNTAEGAPEQQWYTGILPFLRTQPPVRTRCPNIYGVCLTTDVPPPPPPNQPPIVSAGADAAVAAQSVALQGSVTDDGRPGPLVSVQWTQVTGPEPAVFLDAASPTSQVTFPVSGVYVLRLTASDGDLSASDDVAVTVSFTVPPQNQAPQVDAGTDVTIQLPTAAATLTGTVTDDGLPGPNVNLEWTQVNGPAAASIDAVDAVSTLATFSAAGTYVLRLTANDGALSASDDVTVTVNAAAPGPSPPPAPSPPPPPSSQPPPTSGGGSAGLLELLLLGVLAFARSLVLRRTARGIPASER
jgi:hypothetical protein